MKHQSVDLSTLLASDHPRPLITADVDKLASSIRDLGLIQPITVKPHTVTIGGLSAPGFQIVAGHHRVAACRALGWTEIDALVVESSGHLQAELIEIDENLCRSELTAAQRSKAVKRRKEIWEALHPVSPQRFDSVFDALPEAKDQVEPLVPPEFATGYKRPPPQEKAFAAETAEASGMTKQAINRHISRAEALGDDLDKVTGTSLDKGVELDALKAMPPEQRAPLIERAVAGEKVTARPAKTTDTPKATHTTHTLIAALKASYQHLLDGVGCRTPDEVVQLICATFGTEHEDDVELFAALDPFITIGHLEPSGVRIGKGAA